MLDIIICIWHLELPSHLSSMKEGHKRTSQTSCDVLREIWKKIWVLTEIINQSTLEPQYFSLPVLLRYNWHITLYPFKAYNIMICYMCYSLVIKSCPLFRDPIDCSPPDSSVHGISQARILEWVAVAISFFRKSSQLKDQTRVFCIAGGFFTTEPRRKPLLYVQLVKLLLQ